MWYSGRDFLKNEAVAATRKNESLIAWTTITYRSVLMAILTLVVVAGVISYFLFPDPTRALLHKVSDAVARGVARIGLGSPPPPQVRTGPQQANFTNIDGTVRVKKGNSNTWVNADPNVPLEKGDYVQTGSDGIARIVFADASNYVVKPDSVIVIEENSMNQQQQTNVSVQVTTGTVDLATATYQSGSRSGVTVAGATANLAPDSAGQVRSNPKDNNFEVMVKKGSAEVTRNNETLAMTDYDRVSFSAGAEHMTKTKEIAPPVLISPANMLPLFTSGGPRAVDFNWTSVQGARIYRLKVSKNPYFSSTVLDKKVATSQLHAAGLAEGAYYWLVQSIDSTGRESVESEKNRFTIVPKGAESVQILLEVEPFVQHGHIIEVRGKTEPGARVMVNSKEVPDVKEGGEFQYFTPPFPNGESIITITAQNSRGGVRTVQKNIVIQ